MPKTTLTPFSENDLPKKTLWTNNSLKSRSTIQCYCVQSFEGFKDVSEYPAGQIMTMRHRQSAGSSLFAPYKVETSRLGVGGALLLIHCMLLQRHTYASV